VWQKIAPGVKEVLAAVKQTNRLSAAKKRWPCFGVYIAKARLTCSVSM
jgi:hypothetical protein